MARTTGGLGTGTQLPCTSQGWLRLLGGEATEQQQQQQQVDSCLLGAWGVPGTR